MIKNGMRPVHPGEVLREDFLIPLGLSANALAKALNVPALRINDSVCEARCQRRYRHAACALLRWRCALVAEPPIRIRPASRRDREREAHRSGDCSGDNVNG